MSIKVVEVTIKSRETISNGKADRQTDAQDWEVLTEGSGQRDSTRNIKHREEETLGWRRSVTQWPSRILLVSTDP